MCCVTGTDNNAATDIDTGTDTHTDTADADTEAVCELHFVNHISYRSCFDDVCAFLTYL